MTPTISRRTLLGAAASALVAKPARAWDTQGDVQAVEFAPDGSSWLETGDSIPRMPGASNKVTLLYCIRSKASLSGNVQNIIQVPGSFRVFHTLDIYGKPVVQVSLAPSLSFQAPIAQDGAWHVNAIQTHTGQVWVDGIQQPVRQFGGAAQPARFAGKPVQIGGPGLCSYKGSLAFIRLYVGPDIDLTDPTTQARQRDPKTGLAVRHDPLGLTAIPGPGLCPQINLCGPPDQFVLGPRTWNGPFHTNPGVEFAVHGKLAVADTDPYTPASGVGARAR